MNLRVSDIKQYFYCQRIVYHTYYTPIPRPVTHPMQIGAVEHEILSVFERRRSLKRYGLQTGRRTFHVSLNAPSIGICGVLDMLIDTEEQAYPVEFKHTTRRLNPNAKYQLTAYAMMLEECLGKRVEYGFIYRIPSQHVTVIAMTDILRRRTRQAIADIQQILQYERMPTPTKQRGKCVECEFRRFCRDVL